MVYLQQDAASERARALRLRGGRWLAGLRIGAGLTQRELAHKLGLAHVTFLSQIEKGRGRVPPRLLIDWAKAVGVHPAEFAWGLLRFYAPDLRAALAGERAGDGGRGRTGGSLPA